MQRPIQTAARVAKRAPGTSSLYAMQEYAGFPKAAQRYIARSLDVGLGRGAPVERWARDDAEAAAVRVQAMVYGRLDEIRAAIPDDIGLEAMETLIAPLVTLIAFDLGQGRLSCFASCRFLYERLFGAAVRPWLPAAFCAAAASPYLHPDRRLALLQSMTETVATAPGWSNREPAFFPEWIHKDDPAEAA